MFKQKTILVMASALLAGMLLSFAYLFITGTFNPLKGVSSSWATEGVTAQWTVTKDTQIRKQNIYLCGDIEEVSEGIQVKGLVGMNQEELMEMFASNDGWQLQFTGPNELLLGRKINDFCDQHQQYRHLGIYQQKVAVFKGPLGIDSQIIEVLDNKFIEDLPPAWQEKLQKASNYHTQSPEVQAQIQKELEFANPVELNAALENIDEWD